MRHIAHKKENHKDSKIIDRLALIIGIIQPLTTLPQIWLIYQSQDASGVSFFMWTSYNIATVIFLIYGIKHKLPPIIWAHIMWLIVQTPMMVSVFFFPN